MRQSVGREDCAEEKNFVVVRTEGVNTQDVIKIPKQQAVCKLCWKDLVKEDGEAVDASLNDSKVVGALRANCECKYNIIHDKCLDNWSSKHGVKCPFCCQEAKLASVTLSLAHTSTKSTGKAKTKCWLKNYCKLLNGRKQKETDYGRQQRS